MNFASSSLGKVMLTTVEVVLERGKPSPAAEVPSGATAQVVAGTEASGATGSHREAERFLVALEAQAK